MARDDGGRAVLANGAAARVPRPRVLPAGRSGSADGESAITNGASAGPSDASGAPDGASATPVAEMVESIIGCKWSVRLLDLCAEGFTRPSEFLRACPGLSAKVMNERWRKMVRYGIVRRTVFGEKPPIEVEYRLTPFGRRFLRITEEVRRLQHAVDTGAIASGEQE